MNPQTSYFGVAVYCSATLTGLQWESTVERTTLPWLGSREDSRAASTMSSLGLPLCRES